MSNKVLESFSNPGRKVNKDDEMVTYVAQMIENGLKEKFPTVKVFEKNKSRRIAISCGEGDNSETRHLMSFSINCNVFTLVDTPEVNYIYGKSKEEILDVVITKASESAEIGKIYEWLLINREKELQNNC